MKIIEPKIEFMDSLHGDEILMRLEQCGRTCYRSDGKPITSLTAERFVKMLISHGHESVLEHEKITVRITTDRAIANEIVRHRLASYSQESTRYCNYSSEKFGGEISVILPDVLKHNLDVLRHLHKCEMLYNTLVLDCGLRPETARDILPNCLATKLVMTCNLREWRHVLKMRTAHDAHPAIREIMNKILLVFKGTIPVVFDDINVAEL